MNYDGVNAKTSGMFGRLLKKSELESISRMRSVEEVGGFLQALPEYAKALKGLGGVPRREEIERRLLLSLHYDFDRIYSFIGDFKIRKFLNAYFLKNEIYMIKQLLCMAYDERDISLDLLSANELFPKKQRLDFDALSKAENIAQFIEGLNGTEFYPALSRVYSEGMSLFELEVQLDLYYYMQLRAHISELDKVNARIMTALTDAEADLRNIIWIYRLKTHYHVGGSLIYACLIPSIHKLTKEYISGLVNAASHAELVSAINQGPYGQLFSAHERMSDAYNAEMGRLYSAARKRNPRSLAPVVAYMYFKERELDIITSLIECVRYGLDQAEAMSYVGLYYGNRGESHG